MVSFARNLVFNAKMKRIKVWDHFIYDYVEMTEIILSIMHMLDNIVDSITMVLLFNHFKHFEGLMWNDESLIVVKRLMIGSPTILHKLTSNQVGLSVNTNE